MANYFLLALIFAAFSPTSFGMECSLGISEQNFIEKLTAKSCPGFLDSADKSYCCYGMNDEIRCCTVFEFILYGAAWLLPVIVVGILLTTIISCICCFCCCCRRQGGRGSFI